MVVKKSLTHKSAPEKQPASAGTPLKASPLANPPTATSGPGNTWRNVARGEVEKQMAKYAEEAKPKGWWSRLASLFRGEPLG